MRLHDTYKSIIVMLGTVDIIWLMGCLESMYVPGILFGVAVLLIMAGIWNKFLNN